MEIHVRDGSKLVEVWLTNSEKRDVEMRERLKPLYREYKKKGCLVAVFESGDQDLAEETGALLCCNRKRLAEQEIQENAYPQRAGAG